MKKILFVVMLLAVSASAQVINWDANRISTAAPLCAGAATEVATSSNNDICLKRAAAGSFKVTTNDLSTRAAMDAKVALTTTTSATPGGSLGAYQGTTAVPNTGTTFLAQVAAASDILIPINASAVAGRRIKISAKGVYTTAAASVLNVELMLCTVSGCATGTVVVPAGCLIVATNQANVLANGQFSLECELISSATVGASGTFMAKGVGGFQLGATTAVAMSYFQDTATAVSAAVDQTVAEYVKIGFKFTTSNASNTSTLQSLSVEITNLN